MVFSLAHSYFELGDFANARTWYARRVEMGGWDEEVFFAMYRVAESMAQIGEPWPSVQDAYLRSWEFRQTRAEPLYAIAFRYRLDRRYELGRLLAQYAANIPLPESDTLFVYTHLYTWCITDEQAICASHIGEHHEAFTLCRRLLASPDLPDRERPRITAIRDISVPAMLEAASLYPDTLAANLIAGPIDAEVTVTLIAGPDHHATEQTLKLIPALLHRRHRRGAIRRIRHRPGPRPPGTHGPALQIPRTASIALPTPHQPTYAPTSADATG